MTQSGWIFSLTQFYFSLGFALIFLALELGLSWVLVIYRIRAWHSVPALYAYRFWVRVFALCCVLAFAASVPAILNLGILWPKFMNRIGDIAGPLIGLAVFTAFIFKTCFLGVMLYGQRVLSELAHTIVLIMVAIGSAATSYWIMAFLAWQQKPTGAILYQGHYIVNDWLAILGGLSPLFFALFLLTGLLLALALMFLVTAVQSKIRPADQGDKSIYKFSIISVFIILALQVTVALLIGIELLGLQPARLAAVLPKWFSDSSQFNFSLFTGLNAELANSNWVLLPLDGLKDFFFGLLNISAEQVQSLGLDSITGLHPPLWLTYVSSRLTVLLVIATLLLAAVSLYWARKNKFELDGLSGMLRFCLHVLAYLIVAMQIVGWLHLFIGSLPYAVYETITLRELGSINKLNEQISIVLLQIVIYILLVYCMANILRHNIRYGVIPVARHRGRA